MSLLLTMISCVEGRVVHRCTHFRGNGMETWKVKALFNDKYRWKYARAICRTIYEWGKKTTREKKSSYCLLDRSIIYLFPLLYLMLHLSSPFFVARSKDSRLQIRRARAFFFLHSLRIIFSMTMSLPETYFLRLALRNGTQRCIWTPRFSPCRGNVSSLMEMHRLQ